MLTMELLLRVLCCWLRPLQWPLPALVLILLMPWLCMLITLLLLLPLPFLVLLGHVLCGGCHALNNSIHFAFTRLNGVL